MEIKRIVITGGPGSGKTALIKALEKSGKTVLHEISRKIILKAQLDGIAQLFLTDSILFSEKLLKGRCKQFKKAEFLKSESVFFDRGLPDVTAYIDYIGISYPTKFSKLCEKHRYDKVYMLPPWKEIYTNDNERYESFEEALKIYQALKNAYKKYNYVITEVPFGSISERVQYINDSIECEV